MRRNLFILILLMLLLPLSAVNAQGDPPNASRHIVQEFSGYLHPADEYYIHVPGLEAGETLYALLENTSGNLDPMVRLVTEEDHETVLAADDDSGHGYDALLQFEIPANGDYMLIASNHGGNTFGEYHLWLGINAPELAGDGDKHIDGKPVANFDIESSEVSLSVQEFISEIDVPTHFYEHELTHLNAGHTLYVYIETTSGNLIPHVELRDFARKVLAASDASDEQHIATLEYDIETGGDHYDLFVGSRDGETTGEFRMLVGLDSPTVLEGHVHEVGDPLIREAIPIHVGFELLQVTGVDQKSENFGVVGTLRAEWVDHTQAFNPADCQCSERAYTDRQFIAFLEDSDIRWPRFVITNQQNERHTHDQTLIIHSDGTLFYEEHLSATLQAPEFDFRRFPFDHQDFWIRVETRYHDDVFVLDVHDNPEFNGYGNQLGEEEWVITDAQTTIRDFDRTSRFSFDIRVKRHLNFYLYRILLPLVLIVGMGWAIFFIDDPDTRIGASSGNLLIFIAFNFTIGDDLPRLGYLTFLDFLLIICFVVTTFIFGLNIYTKRLESKERKPLVTRINRTMMFIYPAFYAASVIVLFLLYF